MERYTVNFHEAPEAAAEVMGKFVTKDKAIIRGKEVAALYDGPEVIEVIDEEASNDDNAVVWTNTDGGYDAFREE